MKYRIPISEESKSLAKIHEQAFTDFFLTNLGYAFLKTYYKAVIKAEGSIAVCAINDAKEIVGFATGCYNANGYNRQLVKHNFIQFLFHAIVLILTKPKAIIRLLKNLEKKPNLDDDGNYAELFSIAVLPETKGLGIGGILLDKFEKEAQIKQCKRIALTTDFYNNDQVLEFYKKNGYKIFYDFYTYPTRRMYKMIKDIGEISS